MDVHSCDASCAKVELILMDECHNDVLNGKIWLASLCNHIVSQKHKLGMLRKVMTLNFTPHPMSGFREFYDKIQPLQKDMVMFVEVWF